MVLSTEMSVEVTVMNGLYTSKQQMQQWAAVIGHVKCICSKPYGKLEVSQELDVSFFESRNPFCIATLLCLPPFLPFYFLKWAIDRALVNWAATHFLCDPQEIHWAIKGGWMGKSLSFLWDTKVPRPSWLFSSLPGGLTWSWAPHVPESRVATNLRKQE